ncbi:MAG: ribonuclease HII [Lysobacterales bacterium]|jgi:ribonuclease HII
MLNYEQEAKNEGFQIVIGIDEAGRGPLAGPVTAAAVVLRNTDFKVTIRDSKKLSPKKREAAFEEIYDKAHVGVGIISESVIDEVNILQATYLAMRNAVIQCIDQVNTDRAHPVSTDSVILLIDGNSFKTELPYDYRTIVKGDDKVLSIAAASIVAKVSRDRILAIYDQIYPEYVFSKHKGYPTKAHKEILDAIGPSQIHRKSFRY